MASWLRADYGRCLQGRSYQQAIIFDFRAGLLCIDISQNDLDFHLQQLDIYQGLLKQGFSKREIVRYFRAKQAETAQQGSQHGDPLTPTPSTFDLCTNLSFSTEPQVTRPSSRESPSNSNITSEHSKHSPPESPANPAVSNTNAAFALTSIEHAARLHAPRQTSLLRFARGASSESPPEKHVDKNSPLSPRSNRTYRRRSETYSYDQSELDENDVACMRTTTEVLEHLSLDDELLPTSVESTRTTIRLVSNLRPEAEAFTSLYMHLNRDVPAEMSEKRADSSSSPPQSRSLPSSPPPLPQRPAAGDDYSSPTLPPISGIVPTMQPKTPETAQRHTHRQYLDGSFSVYDDSMPARLQPQTPADLGRGNHINEYSAAYTAPPGMVRTPATGGRYGHNPRQPSGDLSPTTRALLMRERRQREFMRSARVEGLRIGRTRGGRDGGTEGRNTVNQTINLWREDLDADSVGDENFEDGFATPDLRGIRAMSGNRRGG
ncbi:hypothetical protein LTR70_004505 [Exophiala xenobiotica]|uniref:Uncharacterized protein n=1 Tax=Lithohypha guttulata TaxID=1690604 RepID=A0ABR0KNT0_9EURO|nr:hypothetical protein LTR24_000435 [Lithohypha guttulata]KAK5320423.1 hypothetical protein LTR70_004505 [Exophiala xenobiotica]